MNRFRYGSSDFEWHFEEADLKRYTVTVEKGLPVLLRGKAVDFEEQEKLIRKRARWIREKMLAVASVKDRDTDAADRQRAIRRAFERFMRMKAEERIFNRVRHWEQETGLQSKGCRLFKFG